MKEKNKNNPKINEDKKITLNNDIDLYKISIKTLKESKLSDFEGNLLNELLHQMMENEEDDLLLLENENNNSLKNSKEITYIQKMNSFSKDRFQHLNNSNSLNNNKMNNSAYLKNKTLFQGKYIEFKEFKIEKIIFQMKYNTQMGEDLAVLGSINELGCWDQGRPLRLGWNTGNIWKGTFDFNNKNILDFEYKFIFLSRGHIKQWENGNNRKFILSQIKGLIESFAGGETIIHLKNISGQNIDYNYNDYTLTIICEWNKK